MENVTLINSDPYGEGWIMILNPSNLKEELSNLLQGDQLTPRVHEQIEKAENLKKK